MDRPTKIVNLPESKCDVEVITYLTWGEKEKLQDILLSGAKLKPNLDNPNDSTVGFDTSSMLKSKYALLEIAVKNVKCGEETKAYSKDWMDNLSADDGDFLMAELDKIGKKKI